MTSWSGHAVRKARAHWGSRLPWPCCRCGRLVVPRPWLPHDGWQVDHYPLSREQGGTETQPAHSECNLRAGGRRGAQLTNARRRGPSIERAASARDRNIRGV